MALEKVKHVWSQSFNQKQRVKNEGAHRKMKSFGILQEPFFIVSIILDDPKPSEQANTINESWATISENPYFFEWVVQVVKYSLLAVWVVEIKVEVDVSLAEENNWNWDG